MQIVLLERIIKLGKMGDVVSVKDGYARNFLLPRGKARRANKANLERFEKERARLEAQSLEQKKNAESIRTKLKEKSFILIRQSSETGQLYGSVNARDIAEKLAEDNFAIARNQIALSTAIKSLGIYNVDIILHPEVHISIAINVARTTEEAKRQLRGDDVIIDANDAKNDQNKSKSSRKSKNKNTPPKTKQAKQTIALEDVFDEGVTADLMDDDIAEEQEKEDGVE